MSDQESEIERLRALVRSLEERLPDKPKPRERIPLTAETWEDIKRRIENREAPMPSRPVTPSTVAEWLQRVTRHR